MRSSILVSRIARLVETSGASGDGAALAKEYAAAVAKANARLESVASAADASLIGDAIRIISEEPPLLEEVSTLDFFQLSDWENLCAMNDWTVPPHVDKALMERAVSIGETKDAIAPFLTMYKKAVRTNNVRLAVKSLRRLADLDQSQDWTRNLKQSEKQLQALLVKEFREAKGQAEACDGLAHELLDGVWCEGLSAAGIDEIRAYRAKRDAERRNVEGSENVAILQKCRDGKWDRKLAFSLVRAVDGLVEKGWKIPADAKEVLDDCRARCAREIDEEEREKRWREVNEQLHIAIQKEDCDAIREALAVPEFLDRDPMEDMLSQAQAIFEHAEAARRRKVVQVVVASSLCVMAILGVSGWWLKQKLFQRRCEDEAAALAFQEKQFKEKPQTAIEGMKAALAQLQAESPETYADPKVNQFEARLKGLIAENLTRTNQIAEALAELADYQTRLWTNGVEMASVTNRFGKLERLLARDDQAYRAEYLRLKNGWLDTQAKIEADCRELADRFQTSLITNLNAVANVLMKGLVRDERAKEVAACEAALDEWRSVHDRYATNEKKLAELSVAEKGFNEARETQRAYRAALQAFASAKDAVEVLKARQTLIDDFGTFPEVKRLKALGVTAEDAADVLSASPSLMKSFQALSKNGVSAAEFESFIKSEVASIADLPEYYSLYGVVVANDPMGKVYLVSKGKPSIDKPSYEKEYKVTSDNGQILNFKSQSLVSSAKTKNKVKAVLMPSSEEMMTVVDIANRGSLTIFAFESAILDLIAKHLTQAHEKGYLLNELQIANKYANPVSGWMSPYRRVQFLAWYMRWLKEDLKLMPDDPELDSWYRQLDALANRPVTVPDVDESLAWICLWDSRIRARTADCAKLLNKMPEDWVARYRDAKKTRSAFAAVGKWKVRSAGKVKFDPLGSGFVKNPDAIAVDAPAVKNDHPLYVLRQVDGRLRLVRAFERGEKSVWRKCVAVEKAGGYVLGEPLYHVSVDDKFIDVQKEIQALAKSAGVAADDSRLTEIPLFMNGGK